MEVETKSAGSEGTLLDLQLVDSLEEVYNLYAVLGEYLSLHRAILAQHEAKAAARKRKRPPPSRFRDGDMVSISASRSRRRANHSSSRFSGDEDIEQSVEDLQPQVKRRRKDRMQETFFDPKTEKIERVRRQLESHLSPDKFGPDPFLFSHDHSLFKQTIPGFGLDPEKTDLASQYAYIDQLIMDLTLEAHMLTGEGRTLLCTEKKEFSSQVTRDSHSKAEFNRLFSQLPRRMQKALHSDLSIAISLPLSLIFSLPSYAQFFVREGVSVSRPYLTKKMRDVYHLRKDEWFRLLLDGDVVHVPFSKHERDLIQSLAKVFDKTLFLLMTLQPVDTAAAVQWLPGRTELDVKRYLQDLDAEEKSMRQSQKISSQVDNAENVVVASTTSSPTTAPDTPLAPSLQPSPSRAVNNVPASVSVDVLKEEDPLIFTAPRVSKKVSLPSMIEKRSYLPTMARNPAHQRAIGCKKLLSSLSVNHLSTVPKEAVVDCNLDPTGFTSKMLIGTAKNETSNDATNARYDLERGTYRVLPEHTDTVSSSDFSIDGRHIITSSYDKKIIVRDAATCQVEHYLGIQDDGTVVAGHNEQILNVILHKSRVDCAVSFDVNRILYWDTICGSLRTDITANYAIPGSLVDMTFAEGAFSDVLVVGSEAPNRRGEIRIFDTNTSALTSLMTEPRGMITSIQTNSSSLVLAATKSMLRLFDLRDPTNTVAMLKTMQKDSSATDNRTIVFDIRQPDRPLHILAHLHPSLLHLEASGLVGINTAIWTRDGNCIVTGGEDGFVRVWDIKASSPLLCAYQTNSPICDLDVSPRYDMIVAGCEGASIHLWADRNSNYTLDDEKIIEEVPFSRTRLAGDPGNVPQPDQAQAEAWLNANIQFLAQQLDIAAPLAEVERAERAERAAEHAEFESGNRRQESGDEDEDAMDIDDDESIHKVDEDDEDEDEDEDEDDVEDQDEYEEDEDEDDDDEDDDDDNDDDDDDDDDDEDDEDDEDEDENEEDEEDVEADDGDEDDDESNDGESESGSEQEDREKDKLRSTASRSGSDSENSSENEDEGSRSDVSDENSDLSANSSLSYSDS